MTTPRSIQIDLGTTPYYHLISRCVRQSYLCGYDSETKKNYDHRKKWLIDRIKHLASIFYIQIASYSIMDNHYHLVVHVDATQALYASYEEILCKWEALCPNDAKLHQSLDTSEEAIIKKIAIWRKRLADISFFMKLLNESIARMANKEDRCTGRFWQGRFKSQALLDEAAILAAMVYTDLNPIRAKIAATPETSEFTSIRDRIQKVKQESKKANLSTKISVKNINELNQPIDLMPFSTKELPIPHIEYELGDYIQLVETTGRIIREDKRGHIPNNLLPIFERLNLQPSGWFTLVRDLEHDFYFAVGAPKLLSAFGRADKSNKTKFRRGTTHSKKCYLNAA